MPPPPLQLEFLPRRRRTWLLPVLVAFLALALGSAVAWLWPRQVEIRRLEQELVRAQATEPNATSRPLPPSAWEAAARQDGQLFNLTTDARLLEIERCTSDAMQVQHLHFDEATQAASVDLLVPDSKELAGLMECLMSGESSAQADKRWTVSSVESVAIGYGPNAVRPPMLKVLLRR